MNCNIEDKIIILTKDDDHLQYFPASRLYSMNIAFEENLITRVDLYLKNVNNLDIETYTGKSVDIVSLDSLCSGIDSEDKPPKKIGF